MLDQHPSSSNVFGYSIDEIERELDRRDLVRKAEACRTSLRSFVELMWPVLHPPSKPLITGWGFDAICDHLEAVSSGDICKLLINVPPGFSKSMLTNVFFPAWEWGPRGMAHLQYVSFAYAQSLTVRDNVRARLIMQSDLYQGLWGHLWSLTDAENSKIKFANDQNGYKIASSVGGTATGERGDRLICDDPNSVKEAESDAKLEDALFFYSEVLPSRTNDERAAFVTIQQRTSHRDVSSQIIRSLGYEELILPMEYEPKFCCYTKVEPKRDRAVEPEHMRRVLSDHDPIPHYVPDADGDLMYRQDPRTDEGELLHPERFSAEYLEKDLYRALRAWGGNHAVASQYQMRPSPRGGGEFQRAWCEFVDVAPTGGVVVRGWDLAGSKSKTAKRTSGVRLRLVAGELYIEHAVAEKWSPGKVKTSIKNTATQDGKRVAISIPQDPGQASLSQKLDFGKDLHGFEVHFSPETGDKVTRFTPFSAQAEIGNVKIVRGHWNDAYLAELEQFPTGDYSDQVDATSRAYQRCLMLSKKRKTRPVAAPILIEAL